jgi:hypothetical protein
MFLLVANFCQFKGPTTLRKEFFEMIFGVKFKMYVVNPNYLDPKFHQIKLCFLLQNKQM